MKKHLLFIFLLLAAYSTQAQSFAVKYNWKKGQKFRFDMNAVQDIKMDNTQSDQTITVGYTILVEDVTPQGNYKCKVTYDVITLENSSLRDMGMQDAINKTMERMSGLSFNIEMSPNSERVIVTGADAMVKDYGYRMFPGTTPEDKFRRDGFIDRMKTQISDSTLKAEFENMGTTFLPPKDVKINDTWTKRVDTKLTTEAKSLYTFRLLSVDSDNTATIEVSVKSDMSGANSAIVSDADLKINGQGTIVMDLKSGLIKSSVITLAGEGTITSETGNIFKANIKSKNTISQKEVKD